MGAEEDWERLSPNNRRLSDPKSMVGASSAEVMSMIPDGWYVVPFPDGRPGFQALDSGKLPGANGQIAAHLGEHGYPLMQSLTGAADLKLYVLNSCWELHCFGSIVNARAKANQSEKRTKVAIDTADAATVLFHNKLVKVWEMDLPTGNSFLLKEKQAELALSMLRNWVRNEADPAMPSTKVVYFLDFTTKGRRAMENLHSKPISLNFRKTRYIRPY